MGDDYETGPALCYYCGPGVPADCQDSFFRDVCYACAKYDGGVGDDCDSPEDEDRP